MSLPEGCWILQTTHRESATPGQQAPPKRPTSLSDLAAARVPRDLHATLRILRVAPRTYPRCWQRAPPRTRKWLPPRRALIGSWPRRERAAAPGAERGRRKLQARQGRARARGRAGHCARFARAPEPRPGHGWVRESGRGKSPGPAVSELPGLPPFLTGTHSLLCWAGFELVPGEYLSDPTVQISSARAWRVSRRFPRLPPDLILRAPPLGTVENLSNGATRWPAKVMMLSA